MHSGNISFGVPEMCFTCYSARRTLASSPLTNSAGGTFKSLSATAALILFSVKTNGIKKHVQSRRCELNQSTAGGKNAQTFFSYPFTKARCKHRRWRTKKTPEKHNSKQALSHGGELERSLAGGGSITAELKRILKAGVRTHGRFVCLQQLQTQQ